MVESTFKRGLGRGLSSLLGDVDKKIETNKFPFCEIQFLPIPHIPLTINK